MKVKKAISFLCTALVLQLPFSAHAGVYSDDLGKCLVSASSPAQKEQLVKWIFFSLSLNPTIKPYANVPQEQRDAADKDMAKLVDNLLGESCLKETQQAIKYEGANAFAESFRLLGQVAGQEIFSSPEVDAGTGNFAKYLDAEKLQQKLQPSGK